MEIMTGIGGRPRISANPIACGMDTSVNVAPAIRSRRNRAQE